MSGTGSGVPKPEGASPPAVPASAGAGRTEVMRVTVSARTVWRIVGVLLLAWAGIWAVLGYAIVYQQIENYWLSPRLSAKTMELNGGLAFGSALAGGALFGPVPTPLNRPAGACGSGSRRPGGRGRRGRTRHRRRSPAR